MWRWQAREWRDAEGMQLPPGLPYSKRAIARSQLPLILWVMRFAVALLFYFVICYCNVLLDSSDVTYRVHRTYIRVRPSAFTSSAVQCVAKHPTLPTFASFRHAISFYPSSDRLMISLRSFTGFFLRSPDAWTRTFHFRRITFANFSRRTIFLAKKTFLLSADGRFRLTTWQKDQTVSTCDISLKVDTRSRSWKSLVDGALQISSVYLKNNRLGVDCLSLEKG